METINSTSDSLSIAKSLLLDSYSLTESDIDRAFGEIITNKIDYADLYFQCTLSEGWNLEESLVKTGHFFINQGVGVRAISDGKTAFSYSDSLEANMLISAAKTVASIARRGSGQAKIPSYISLSTQHNLYDSLNPLKTLHASEKVNLLESIDHMARASDSRITQVMSNLMAEYDVILIAGSDGRLVADVRPLVRLSITVIAEYGSRREIGHSGGGSRSGLNYFSKSILQNYVQRAVHEAITNLSALPAPAGEMTVILGPGWPGILLHEAVGHGLEGDFNRKGSSIFSGKIGERVASKGITIIDNGTLPNCRGSLNIDDEGNQTKSNILIEDGILCGYMQDVLNAKLMNTTVTGNGRRESFRHLPMPRMTNTYMENGQVLPKDIIASVKEGLYAVNFDSGQVDITNGKFVFSASEAYMIKNGKIIHPVKGATLIGNGPDVMKKISLIGNDLKLDSGVGTCGKDGQNVPVCVGQPTLRIDSLIVGGTN